MLFDYTSLLLALGFAGACLCVTMLATWFSARSEQFLLIWAVGLVLIVGHVFVYGSYVTDPQPVVAMAAFCLLILGLALIYSASVLFRRHRIRLWNKAVIAGVAIAIPLAGFASGMDGIGFILANVVAAALLFATAWQYFLAREEAPGTLIGLVILYCLVGISFALCAAVLISNGDWHLAEAPQNWAEELNVGIAVAAMAGVGALSLALNQARLARSHRREALTDSLTGLLNRRALFDMFSARDLPPFTSVVVLDLDRFKVVNDTYGHAVGDEVIRQFAGVLKAGVRNVDVVARLGGEEFALVLPRSRSEPAVQVAERIRRDFEEIVVRAGSEELRCTVSAGVATAGQDGQLFDDVLGSADDALYSAKREGRNRVVAEPLRLVG